MDKSQTKKYSFNYLLDIVTNAFVVLLQRINKWLMSKKRRGITKAIIRIICCFIMLAILKIPFLVFGVVGKAIIYICSSTFSDVLSGAWSSIIHYAYSLLSIVILFKVIKGMSSQPEYHFEIKNSTQIGDNLYYAIKVILQIIIVVSLIPMILADLLLFAFVGMFFGFLTHGIYIFGPLLILIGLIVIVTSSLSFIGDIIFFDKGGAQE